MKLFKSIVVVSLIFFGQFTLAQVSKVDGIKPREGVVIPKVKSVKPLASGAVFKDCNECPQMITIPSGTFIMGSPPDPVPDPFSNENRKIGLDNEKPQHRVQIQSFAIGKYEVTQEEWYAVMGTNPSENKGRTLPVENISWDDAQDFVKRLSQKTGKNYRLPSEAEWEYAARGGSTTLYPWGDSSSSLSDYAWVFTKNAWSTNPVGLKKPNKFGIYDMIGNVFEWTQDCWNGNYEGAPIDGSAWTTGDCSQRVARGGSWNSLIFRAAYRSYHPTAYGNFFEIKGFRVARTN